MEDELDEDVDIELESDKELDKNYIMVIAKIYINIGLLGTCRFVIYMF